LDLPSPNGEDETTYQISVRRVALPNGPLEIEAVASVATDSENYFVKTRAKNATCTHISITP